MNIASGSIQKHAQAYTCPSIYDTTQSFLFPHSIWKGNNIAGIKTRQEFALLVIEFRILNILDKKWLMIGIRQAQVHSDFYFIAGVHVFH